MSLEKTTLIGEGRVLMAFKGDLSPERGSLNPKESGKIG